MNKSENIDKLATALNKAQSEMRGAIKDSDNPFFKSKYADLESCWEACKEPLTKNGLSVTQTFDGSNLVTTLLHTSGQWLGGSVPISPVKNDPQTFIATVTYLRRSSLAALVGLVQVDDDGNTASQVQNYELPRPEVPQSKPVPTGPLVYNPKTPIPIGKNKGSPIDQWPIEELRRAVTWMQEKAAKDNNPIENGSGWDNFINQVKMHEAHLSKSKLHREEPTMPEEDLPF